MTIKTKPGDYYRMPVFFGPMHGPRHWPEGTHIDRKNSSKRRSFGVNFLTDAATIEKILPPGFSLWGEPVITVEVTYVTEIAWLAGRGYNLCDVKLPAIYNSKGGPVHGTLVLIRWENMADPIISGREELGHNKLYCEIPPLRELNDEVAVDLSWLSFPFLRVRASGLAEVPLPAANSLNRGTLSYKYVPRTGVWGEADVEYATLTPNTLDVRTTRRLAGTGTLEFLPTTWRDMPTQSYIIEALREWPNRGYRGAYISEGLGVADTEGTHILE